MFALDDALLGWLISSAGTEMFRRLRGDRVNATMRKVVAEAVDATIDEVAQRGHQLGPDVADELRRALLSRRDGIGSAQVGDRLELETTLLRWVDSSAMTQLAERGDPTTPELVAECLARNIIVRIHANARGGGALAPLSDWLWRGEAVEILGRIEYKVDRMQVANYSGSHLPGETPDFTGRERAVEELSGRLEAHDPSGTVVSISSVTGMAGVGKTALALHVAHRFTARFPDGQFFIDLYGFTPACRRSPRWWRWSNCSARPVCRATASHRTWSAGRPAGVPTWPDARPWSCWTTRSTPRRSRRCCRCRPAAW
ncbi:hypothetical protein GCM10027614_19330 [Micromonospora vulcania]